MTATRRFLGKAKLKRQTYLAVLVLPDEASAFQAYRLLQYHGISPEHLAIVGEGYSSPDRVGILEPMQIARRKARSLAIFTGTLAAIATTAICIIWPLGINWALLVPTVAIIGGFCGAVLGGLLGFFGEGSMAGIYRHHLRQGRYLLMIEGPEKLVRWGQEILNRYCVSKA